MSIVRSAATLRNLREQPMWKLLAAAHAPVIAALLDRLLLQDEKVHSASTLEERLTLDIEALRAQGYELPDAAWSLQLGPGAIQGRGTSGPRLRKSQASQRPDGASDKPRSTPAFITPMKLERGRCQWLGRKWAPVLQPNATQATGPDAAV